MGAEHSLEEKIVSILLERGWQVTCAESCSGGMIASRLVNVAGVSEVFGESYVTYSNSAKHKLLGVSQQTLQDHGAVSPQVAEEMARGAAGQAKARAAIAVTGIAGPGGGTQEKPVGLVYIGCYVDGKVFVAREQFQGSRLEIRTLTTEAALSLLLDKLQQDGE